MGKLTTGELEIMFKNLDEKLSSHMDQSKENYNEQNNKLDLILEQTRKTNGRVSRHDEIIETILPIVNSYQENKLKLSGVITLWGVIGTFVLSTFSYGMYLYIEKQKSEIENHILAEIKIKTQ